MKRLTILAFCIIAVFSACKEKKENTPDLRDPCVGTWEGLVTFTEAGKLAPELESGVFKITKQENTTDKIAFTGEIKNPSKPQIRGLATVKGNTFTIDTKTGEDTDVKTKEKKQWSEKGGGSIGDKTLTGSITREYSSADGKKSQDVISFVLNKK